MRTTRAAAALVALLIGAALDGSAGLDRCS
jgi:hypothetical protein